MKMQSNLPDEQQQRVYVNAKQVEFLNAKQKRKTYLAGRGAGKTTTAGHQTRLEVNYLPRAKFFLAGLTYNQLTRIMLPAMEEAWAFHGLKRYDAKTRFGHYVVGTKPPENWYRPYQAPRNFENTVTFLNGYTLELLSMDRPDTARGGNYDGGHMDESALLKRENVAKVLRPMIRANKHRSLSNHYLHHGFCDYTSVPWLPSGQWVFETEELAQKEPEKYLYLEATAYDNMEVLGEEYLSDLRASMTQLEWDVEVMNVRLSKVPNSFYPSFSEEKHAVWKTFSYEHDEQSGLTLATNNDRDRKRPLEASFDFNAGFTSVILCQEHGQEFRVVGEVFVKQSDTTVLSALVTKFCDEYADHQAKHLIIYGDRNGNNKQVNSTQTHYEIIQEKLAERGWTSQVMVHGLDPDHRLKHIAINELLAETNPRLPVIRINRNTCKFLIISISQAPINPDWTKNKSSEKQLIDQARATHLSDCFDNIVYRKYGKYFGRVSRPMKAYVLGR